MNVMTEPTEPRSLGPNRKYRVLLADDHPLFRRGVAELVGTTPDFEVVAQASSAVEALSKVRQVPIDIAILDVSFHGTNGLELTKQLRAEKPELRIILLSMHDEQLYAIRALKSGAQGYVMKRENPEMLIEALRKVAEGGIYVSQKVSDTLVYRTVRAEQNEVSPIDLLSDRELEVLQLFGEGNTTQEIANLLHLSAKTIETHRLHIKEKLGFRTAAELIRFAVNWVALQSGDSPDTTRLPREKPPVSSEMPPLPQEAEAPAQIA
jgi:DNA-binding NarL/FixJ family response regulator